MGLAEASSTVLLARCQVTGPPGHPSEFPNSSGPPVSVHTQPGLRSWSGPSQLSPSGRQRWWAHLSPRGQSLVGEELGFPSRGWKGQGEREQRLGSNPQDTRGLGEEEEECGVTSTRQDDQPPRLPRTDRVPGLPTLQLGGF